MIRFAILAGVSTEAQARDDKLSIPDQVQHCRNFITANGGVESSGPYIMDGYSRSGYDSLEVAMREIPPLDSAIQEATNNKYDILIMDNFDRLGDLGFIVKTRFKKIRKQLHSARQSGKVTLPELYDPYADDNTDIEMHVEGIIQTYRINKIRRGWNIGVPERAATGLHPLCTSFGYKAGTKGEPAIQIPDEIKLVIAMKDKFLAGETLQRICDYADASGVKPRRADAWSRNVIKRIILNRFYAGHTIFGKQKKINGKRITLPQSQWVIGEGKHQALWDDTTYQALLAEEERRDNRWTRAKVYSIAGLLVCSVCEQRLYRHGRVDSKYQVVLSCRHSPSHVVVEYRFAHQWIAKLVVDELKAGKYKEYPVSEDLTRFDQQLAQRHERRQKVQEGFESNIYTSSEANIRLVSIETEVNHLIAQRHRAEQRTVHQQALLKFAEQDLDKMYQWIMEDDPTTVNHLLTALCERITITPSYEMSITWR